MAALPLLTTFTRWLALFAVAASFVLPFEGMGLDLCALHWHTGLPCPGCGLTRGFIALSRGELALAAGANPFSLVLFPLFVVLAVTALGPDGMHRALGRWLQRHHRLVAPAYRVGVASFLGFGTLRLGWFLLNGEEFP